MNEAALQDYLTAAHRRHYGFPSQRVYRWHHHTTEFPMTLQQIVDSLNPGDIVEITDGSYPNVKTTGPLRKLLTDGPTGLGLALGTAHLIRHSNGEAGASVGDVKVIERAKRPVYINSDHTEHRAGDVVRNADDLSDTRTWTRMGSDYGSLWWPTDAPGHLRVARTDLPARLRLLVDGDTGQPVR